MTEREQKTRSRAVHLWKLAGTPKGRDQEFWFEAERQIILEEKNNQPDPGPTSKTKIF